MIKVSGFKPCKSNPPTKDGKFLVVRFNEDGALRYGSSLEFHTKYGWNTCFLTDGTPYTENKMEFDDDTVWAEITEVKDNECVQ